MGTYTTTKCGYCGYRFESMNYGSHSKIGPPKIKCIGCEKINKTSFKLYRDTNFWERLNFWSGQVFSSIILGLFSLIFGSGSMLYYIFSGKFAKMWEIDNYFGIIFFMAFFIGMAYFGYYNIKDIFYTKRTCKLMEKAYDQNGGYLSSNQFY